MRWPETAALFAASEATWPPASRRRIGPVTIREGLGGGSRVSAATASGPATESELDAAEQAMRDLGQPCLFMIPEGQDDLDRRLSDRGYRIKDPVTIHAAPVVPLAQAPLPPLTAIEVWPPLAIQVEIWAAGGIGPARLAVMERAAFPRTTLLGRLEDSPAGTAFVACHDGIAMLHALEIAPWARRRGLGRNLLIAAARWANRQGATWLALLVTRANGGANALYSRAGMTPVGHYHYRISEDAHD